MANESTDGSMISSKNVTGTTVYGMDGSKVGSIDHLMIDKVSGKVGYAVMDFGGFLGVGQSERPVPWNKLTYDTSKGGYVTNLTKEQVEGAPKHESNWQSDRDWETRTYRHYGADPYWI